MLSRRAFLALACASGCGTRRRSVEEFYAALVDPRFAAELSKRQRLEAIFWRNPARLLRV